MRVLTEDDQLIAWAEVPCNPEPQDRAKSASCPFWPVDGSRKTNFVAEADGTATKISVHWCDLNIARVNPVFENGGVEVKTGQLFTFHWFEPVWLTAGMKNVPLPATTINNNITISPPTGSLNAISSP